MAKNSIVNDLNSIFDKVSNYIVDASSTFEHESNFKGIATISGDIITYVAEKDFIKIYTNNKVEVEICRDDFEILFLAINIIDTKEVLSVLKGLEFNEKYKISNLLYKTLELESCIVELLKNYPTDMLEILSATNMG